MNNYPYYTGSPMMNQQYNWNQSPAQRLQNYEQQFGQQNTQPNNNSIIWVQGAEGAKSFMLPPNSSAMLMDSEGSRFYLKSTDNSGMPSLRVFDFHEVTNSFSASPQVSNTVSRTEFDELKNKVEQYEGLFNSLTSPAPAKQAKSAEVNKNG